MIDKKRLKNAVKFAKENGHLKDSIFIDLAEQYLAQEGKFPRKRWEGKIGILDEDVAYNKAIDKCILASMRSKTVEVEKLRGLIEDKFSNMLDPNYAGVEFLTELRSRIEDSITAIHNLYEGSGKGCENDEV